MNTSILVFLGLVSIVASCPGLFGGLLGGGGGGCGCGAPPPPPCGAPPPCGGRKKRSLPEKPVKPEFFGIASNDADELCNTPALKKIIVQNMNSNAVDSTKSLQSALESNSLHRYVAVCSETPFVYTVRADTGYCGARKNGHYCHAFAL